MMLRLSQKSAGLQANGQGHRSCMGGGAARLLAGTIAPFWLLESEAVFGPSVEI